MSETFILQKPANFQFAQLELISSFEDSNQAMIGSDYLVKLGQSPSPPGGNALSVGFISKVLQHNS